MGEARTITQPSQGFDVNFTIHAQNPAQFGNILSVLQAAQAGSLPGGGGGAPTQAAGQANTTQIGQIAQVLSQLVSTEQQLMQAYGQQGGTSSPALSGSAVPPGAPPGYDTNANVQAIDATLGQLKHQLQLLSTFGAGQGGATTPTQQPASSLPTFAVPQTGTVNSLSAPSIGQDFVTGPATQALNMAFQQFQQQRAGSGAGQATTTAPVQQQATQASSPQQSSSPYNFPTLAKYLNPASAYTAPQANYAQPTPQTYPTAAQGSTGAYFPTQGSQGIAPSVQQQTLQIVLQQAAASGSNGSGTLPDNVSQYIANLLASGKAGGSGGGSHDLKTVTKPIAAAEAAVQALLKTPSASNREVATKALDTATDTILARPDVANSEAGKRVAANLGALSDKLNEPKTQGTLKEKLDDLKLSAHRLGETCGLSTDVATSPAPDNHPERSAVSRALQDVGYTGSEVTRQTQAGKSGDTDASDDKREIASRAVEKALEAVRADADGSDTALNAGALKQLTAIQDDLAKKDDAHLDKDLANLRGLAQGYDAASSGSGTSGTGNDATSEGASRSDSTSAEQQTQKAECTAKDQGAGDVDDSYDSASTEQETGVGATQKVKDALDELRMQTALLQDEPDDPALISQTKDVLGKARAAIKADGNESDAAMNKDALSDLKEIEKHLNSPTPTSNAFVHDTSALEQKVSDYQAAVDEQPSANETTDKDETCNTKERESDDDTIDPLDSDGSEAYADQVQAKFDDLRKQVDSGDSGKIRAAFADITTLATIAPSTAAECEGGKSSPATVRKFSLDAVRKDLAKGDFEGAKADLDKLQTVLQKEFHGFTPRAATAGKYPDDDDI